MNDDNAALLAAIMDTLGVTQVKVLKDDVNHVQGEVVCTSNADYLIFRRRKACGARMKYSDTEGKVMAEYRCDREMGHEMKRPDAEPVHVQHAPFASWTAFEW